jgi:tetratricopeptide (TPR) repeat protein
MTRLIHETLQLQEQDLIDDALLRIQFAIKIDPDAPVAHYVEAELLESLGRPGEAEAAYARSREMTIGNLGSQLSINRVIREVAADQQAELVDLRKIFDDFQHNRKRHFNVELIHDDCHPTPLAHSLIAQHLMLRLFTPGTATAPPTAP